MVLINFSNRQRKVKLPQNVKTLLTSAVKASLEVEGVSEPTEVNITFVSDEGIKNINRDFRNINKSTDVLSFPLGENGVYDVNNDTGAKLLGDIVISIPHAVDQADRYGHSLQREIGFLTVHSMLHLLGYDHVNGGMESVRMREKEESVLTKLGLKRNSSYYMDDENV